MNSRVSSRTINARLPLMIAVEEDTYRIWDQEYRRASDDEHIYEQWTKNLLRIFRKVEDAVLKSQSVRLDPEFCQEQLRELASWGQAAYNWFFCSDARSYICSLIDRADKSVYFRSEKTLFPWELLYESNDEEGTRDDPQGFWGLRYTIARNLKRTSQDYPQTQHSTDMLFCLHHALWYAHKQECEDIRRIVTRPVSQGHFCLLGSDCDFHVVGDRLLDGEAVMRYLHRSSHTMLHFACHCKQRDDGDILLLSLLDKGKHMDMDDAQEITLEPRHFVTLDKHFVSRPFVFLNACQSASLPDDLGRIFNLPRIFVKYGAGAVIATLCPVPDLFAAAFAKEFYTRFLDRGQPIGQALKETRWHFLEKEHNPLGLAYGLYTPAEYQVVRPRTVGGFTRHE